MKTRNTSRAFALPTVLIISIIMLSVLVSAVSSTSSTRVALMNQHYDELSRQAADAGVVYAKACIAADSGKTPRWSDAKPLMPNTDCNGDVTHVCPETSTDPECSVLVTDNNKTITSFTVPKPNPDSKGVYKDIHANGHTKLFRTNGELWRDYASKSSSPLGSLLKKELPSCTSLADCTWEEVGIIADAGKGDDYFNIGDTKDMTLSTGEVLTMQIYGFDHDEKADNTGYTNITFGTKNLMTSTRWMNGPSSNNYNGWEGSDMRGWLNGVNTYFAGTKYTNGTTSLYSQIPNDIKSNIVQVKKDTTGGYNNPVVVTSMDKLFLFSYYEVYGEGDKEGIQYPVFTDDTSRVKMLSNGSGGNTSWWQRSPYYASSYGDYSSFNISLLSGGSTYVTSPYQGGVAFGFSLGTAPNIPPIGTSLASCTWQQVVNIANAGLGDVYFDIGDTKDLRADGKTVKMQIYDFNHDVKSDGTGLTNITFGTKYSVADDTMNASTFNNIGGWDGATLRSWTNGALYNSMPNSVKDGIKTVNKLTSAGNKSATITTSNDKVFLFSQVEMTGASTTTFAGEGTKYSIFTDTTSLIKKGGGETGIAVEYWNRSPNKDSTSQYTTILPTGLNGVTASTSVLRGVVYGFSLGNVPKYDVTFNSQGGSTVLTQNIEVNKTVTKPTDPTKSGYIFAGWYKDAAYTTAWNFTTDKVTADTTLYAKWVASLPAVGTPLESFTWDQIAYISETGQADTYFDIGNTKNITLSTNEVLTMQIYDFNHDDKSDGSGKAGITFGTKNLMTTLRQMNSSDTNGGGWDLTAMRSWANNTLYYQLPTNTQSVVKQVKKLTTRGVGSTVITTSNDKVFLFSEIEIVGSNNYSDPGEGYKYPIFTTAATRIKSLSNGAGASNSYWSRSSMSFSYSGYATAFIGIGSDGMYLLPTASFNNGVAFGFCI